MKKIYVKYKKLLIFCITLVLLCCSFCVSAFAVETVDGKLSFNIPIAKPQIERTESTGIAYAEILYNDRSAVEVVIISFSDLGLTAETEPLRIFADVTYGAINFKINKRGIISMFRISSNGSNDIEIAQGSNAQDYGVTSYFTNVKGFRVYGVDRVTSWASSNIDGLNNNFIVNYGSDIVANDRTSAIISSLQGVNDNLDNIEDYTLAQYEQLISLFEEQQKTNTFLGQIKDYLYEKLDAIHNSLSSIWLVVDDIRHYIVGNKDEQPVPEDSTIVENEQAEQEIRDETDYGFDNAEYLIGSFSQTADSNSNIGRAMVGIASMVNETTQMIIPDLDKLLTWSMVIGLICFILGMAQSLSGFKSIETKKQNREYKSSQTQYYKAQIDYYRNRG